MDARRLAPLLSCLLLSGPMGCKDKGSADAGRSRAEARDGCDQDQLAALASKLDAAKPDARVMLVSEGLLEACGEALYPVVQDMLRQVASPGGPLMSTAQMRAHKPAVEAMCPEHGRIGEVLGEAKPAERGPAVAELCGFDRYELVGEDELRALHGHALFVWANHEFLLEAGTPEPVAKTISRALFRVYPEVYGPVLINPPEGLELIAAPATARPHPGPLIYISASELVLNEEPLVRLKAGELDPAMLRGHTIAPLYERLEEERDKGLAVDPGGAKLASLVVGANVRFDAVVDAVYTASRVGYEHFDFVVEAAPGARRTIRVELPVGERRARPSFKVFILADGFAVTPGPDQAQTKLAKLDAGSNEPEAWDLPGLVALARKHAAANPQLGQVLLSTEPNMTMDVVLTTYASLLGEGCDQAEGGDDCIFPELVIEAGAG